jgi:hypothetical protein
LSSGGCSRPSGPRGASAGGTGTATDADSDATLDARILEFLKYSPYSYGKAVCTGVKARKEDVIRRLQALAPAR